MPRPSKRDAILKESARLLIEHGYRGISMEEIAARIPVSKPTLYAHFADKRALFQAVVDYQCGQLIARMTPAVDPTRPPEETLLAIGDAFLSMVLSKPAIQMHRMLTAELAEFPDAAAMFYAAGPQQMHRFVHHYLAGQHRAGRLHVTDAALSADMFLSMVKGYLHLRCLMGIARPPGKAQRRLRVRKAVAMFLAAHKPL